MGHYHSNQWQMGINNLLQPSTIGIVEEYEKNRDSIMSMDSNLAEYKQIVADN